MLLPTTAASTAQPVSLAMACAAAMVSQETRLSLPCCCSTMTRIVSGIGTPEPLQHVQFVAQLVDQLFGDVRRRAFERLRLLGFLWHVQAFDLLKIRGQRALHFRESNLAQGFMF